MKNILLFMIIPQNHNPFFVQYKSRIDNPLRTVSQQNITITNKFNKILFYNIWLAWQTILLIWNTNKKYFDLFSKTYLNMTG